MINSLCVGFCHAFFFFYKSRYLIELLIQNASALVTDGVQGFTNTRRFLTEGVIEPSSMNIE